MPTSLLYFLQEPAAPNKGTKKGAALPPSRQRAPVTKPKAAAAAAPDEGADAAAGRQPRAGKAQAKPAAGGRGAAANKPPKGAGDFGCAASCPAGQASRGQDVGQGWWPWLTNLAGSQGEGGIGG
jgi:hypothetical protein